ncbi:cyclin-like protein [Mycena olivaceomarginata]|nr:cyclin-like protein [Mycena olivaceomarginata]
MASQTAFAGDMCALLNNWLLQVHTHFHLLPETLFLSMHLIDCFLSLRVVAPPKLQLVGMISDGAFSNTEMQQAEQHVLCTLGWDLSYLSPMHWLRQVSKAEGYQTQTRQLGKYLAEIVLVEGRLVGMPPSPLATATMWLMRLALREGDWLPASSTAAKDEDEDATVTAPKHAYVLWTPTLAHYTMYAEAELLPAVQDSPPPLADHSPQRLQSLYC